jgi:hypothetical protein
MKTIRKNIAAIVTTAAALIAAPSSHAVNRTLILLQENSGVSFLNDLLDGPAETAAQAIVDQFAEGGETASFQLLVAPHYQHFINLSNTACTRTNLRNALINETVAGYTIDLAVLGHGGNEVLVLNNGTLTGGAGGNIRSLLTEAKALRGSSFKFNLRLVNMCNCVASTLNDDWLAIGARVSVGSIRNDYMPEPMITSFWHDFVSNDKRVTQAATDAYTFASGVWGVVPGYNTANPTTGTTPIEDSHPVVAGDGNIIFKDECQLKLNEQRTISVSAKNAYTFPGIYLVSGQRYTYSASGTWNSGAFGSPTVNANGYAPGVFDAARRNPANMMRLVGERFNHNGDVLSFVGGSGFSIGTSNTLTAGGFGFLNLYANDVITGYGDNSGSVTVTIRRIQ